MAETGVNNTVLSSGQALSQSPGHISLSADTRVQNIRGSVFEALTRGDVSVEAVRNDYEAFRQEKASESCLPDRLLHVKTMTVHQLENGTYMGQTNPEFAILTYKWGIWKITSGKTLQVKGVTWPIPVIDPARWTVAELEKVIKYMAKGYEWVWIDVACVNQDDSGVTLREINNEPLIFKLANKAFVWLVDAPEDDIESSLKVISQVCMTFTPDQTMETMTPMMRSILHPLENLLSCMWFKSPWTLREIVLCHDAVLLNRQGRPALLTDGQDATLKIVTDTCRYVLAWLKQAFQADSVITSDSVRDLYFEFLTLVNSAGPFFLFASLPRTLDKITYELLWAGSEVVDGKISNPWGDHLDGAKDFVFAHGHSKHLKISCRCVCSCDEINESSADKNSQTYRLCIPCLLDISYRVGDTDITPHTEWYTSEEIDWDDHRYNDLPSC